MKPIIILKNIFTQHVFVGIYAFISDNRLNRNQGKEKATNYEFFDVSEYQLDGTSERPAEARRIDYSKAQVRLEYFTKEELDRKKIIEEKGRALLLIISAIVAISTGGFIAFINDLQAIEGALRLGLILLLLGYSFFILGVINVIAGLNINKYHFVTLGQSFVEENGKVYYYEDDPEFFVPVMYRNLKCNYTVNNRRSNHIYACFVNIRNGIVLLACFFLLVTFSKLGAQKDKNRENLIPAESHIISDDKSSIKDTVNNMIPDSLVCD